MGWGEGTCAAPEAFLLEISKQIGVENLICPVKGFFIDTLPSAQVGPVALMHVDGDWYSSTMDVLENLFDKIICHKTACVTISQRQAQAIVLDTSASPLRPAPEPLASRGTGAKEIPSMRVPRVSSLRRRVSGLRRSLHFRSFQAAFASVGPVRSRVRARFPRHHLLSVPACDAEHPMLYAPQAGKTNRLRTKRPLYQDGHAHCTTQANHGRLDQPSTLQPPIFHVLPVVVTPLQG